ncbi:MAG: TetR/AcrR family transcriptional regulator [Gammaproteobacteria bacterium]|nr:TetR/AcrR family transcriptional regulator [Gammaproteobacteria bacterium]
MKYTDDPDLELSALKQEVEAFDQQLPEKQKKIVEVAERLFGQKGFAATPTAEIAKEAGTTERTLFKYFPSKNDLLRRILLPILLRFVAPDHFRQVRQVMTQHQDSYESFVRAFIQNRVEAIGQNPGKIRILLYELANNENFRIQFTQIFLDHIYAPMSQMIKKFQSQGMLRSDIDCDVIIRSQIALVLGYCLNKILFEPEIAWNDEEQIDQLVALLTKGLIP